MSETPVAELRDREARTSAIRQYLRASRRHSEAGDVFMARGWFEWAGPELVLGDRLDSVALLERTDPKPDGLE